MNALSPPSGRPWIILVAVQSVDGFITRGEEAGTAFASEEDQSWFRCALQRMDAVAFGSGTYLAERERLRARLDPSRPKIVLTRQPETYATDAVPEALEFTDESPEALARQWQARGFHRVGLIGGSVQHARFLEAGLVDELWLTVEPWLFGHGKALAPVAAPIALSLLDVEALSKQTLLLRYAVGAG